MAPAAQRRAGQHAEHEAGQRRHRVQRPSGHLLAGRDPQQHRVPRHIRSEHVTQAQVAQGVDAAGRAGQQRQQQIAGSGERSHLPVAGERPLDPTEDGFPTQACSSPNTTDPCPKSTPATLRRVGGRKQLFSGGRARHGELLVGWWPRGQGPGTPSRGPACSSLEAGSCGSCWPSTPTITTCTVRTAP